MYSQANETRTVFHWEVVPECGIFQTARHEYLTRFRHINKDEYKGQPRPATSPRGSDTPVHEDYSYSAFIEIKPVAKRFKKHQSDLLWMEVCPGGCNKEGERNNGDFDVSDDPEVSSLSGEDIARILNDRIRAYYKLIHPKLAPVIEIVATRVVWSKSSPIPAYFSPRKIRMVRHSSAVTLAHLALLQARDFVDHIEVDFRTHHDQYNENLDQTHHDQHNENMAQTHYSKHDENLDQTYHGQHNENLDQTHYSQHDENLDQTYHSQYNENLNQTHYGQHNENMAQTYYGQHDGNLDQTHYGQHDGILNQTYHNQHNGNLDQTHHDQYNENLDQINHSSFLVRMFPRLFPTYTLSKLLGKRKRRIDE
ncbi:hypothetical protein F5B21DRAFT_528074 [Xylaria acuta]|nr:hypothetical protein F5B21DRAFT_528074 [Xylaria acuta]